MRDLEELSMLHGGMDSPVKAISACAQASEWTNGNSESSMPPVLESTNGNSGNSELSMLHGAMASHDAATTNPAFADSSEEIDDIVMQIILADSDEDTLAQFLWATMVKKVLRKSLQ